LSDDGINLIKITEINSPENINEAKRVVYRFTTKVGRGIRLIKVIAMRITEHLKVQSSNKVSWMMTDEIIVK
jgi:predicted transcriptional regulator